MGGYADRVAETTTTTGTGMIALAGAVSDYQAFSSAFVDGDSVYYCIYGGTDWEVGRGSFFSPPLLSGLQLWLRADKGITIATGVSSWQDQSGIGDPNRNVVQPTGGNQPTYTASDSVYNNKPTLGFASASSQTIASGVWTSGLTNPETIFYVGNDDGTTTRQFYITTTPGGNPNFEHLTTEMYNGNLPKTITTSAASVVGGVYDGTSSSLYVNTTTPVTGDAGVAPATMTKIFLGSNVASGLFLNGKMAEVIIYNRTLSTAEIVAVLSYLSFRYNVSVSGASSGTLLRDQVYASSNSGSLVNLAAGTHTVFCTTPAAIIADRGLAASLVAGLVSI